MIRNRVGHIRVFVNQFLPPSPTDKKQNLNTKFFPVKNSSDPPVSARGLKIGAGAWDKKTKPLAGGQIEKRVFFDALTGCLVAGGLDF